jgi:hypothetical protein
MKKSAPGAQNLLLLRSRAPKLRKLLCKTMLLNPSSSLGVLYA